MSVWSLGGFLQYLPCILLLLPFFIPQPAFHMQVFPDFHNA
jgi:hypothetical protein